MRKSIVELCRALPEPEAERELRERVREFHQAICSLVFGWHEWDGKADYDGEYPMFCVGDWGSYAVVYEAGGDGDFDRYYDALAIGGAKATTDAMIARGFSAMVAVRASNADCSLYNPWVEDDQRAVRVIVTASTEEIARAACALLAATVL